MFSLGEKKIPKKVQSAAGAVNALEKCIWILRKKFHFSTTINEIQHNLLSLNKPYLDCMADTTINGLKCKGKNDTRQGKKTKMSPIDTWNAHVLSNFLRNSIWPTNKILSKK